MKLTQLSQCLTHLEGMQTFGHMMHSYCPKTFNSSPDIQYIAGLTQEPLSQQYMLSYTTLVMAMNQTVATE